MKGEFGTGLKEFLGNRDYTTASSGLKQLYGEYKSWDKFIDLAKSLGFKWSQIYTVKELLESYECNRSRELEILLLHILWQYDVGNLRTNINSINTSLNEWYPNDLIADFKSVVSNNPALFGREAEPFLLVDNYIYINRIKKYEERFLELLGNRLKYSDNFLIISGGPGTGKTTKIVSIIKDYISNGITNIAITAPTGRAAKRVIESIHRDSDQSEIGLPTEAFTLHKLLGINPFRDKPTYNSERLLKYDVVIVDEASMVDIHMMFRLFDALPITSKLILVGDKDQLPSVEAGALLGDFLHDFKNPQHKMHNCITLLEKSYRSVKTILECSKLVIGGQTKAVLEFVKNSKDVVLYHELPNIDKLMDIIVENYSGVSTKGFNIPVTEYKKIIDKIEKVFKIHEEFTVLCPSKKGLYGTYSINSRIKRELSLGYKEFYHSEPVMITRNDYINELYNGDRGVIFEFNNGYYAFFRVADGFKAISISKLNDYETSYAGTVHKSQGSEFDSVYIIIPEGSEKLLTREILYTALTRAKKRVELFSSDNEITISVNRRIHRESGIRNFLLNKIDVNNL